MREITNVSWFSLLVWPHCGTINGWRQYRRGRGDKTSASTSPPNDRPDQEAGGQRAKTCQFKKGMFVLPLLFAIWLYGLTTAGLVHFTKIWGRQETWRLKNSWWVSWSSKWGPTQAEKEGDNQEAAGRVWRPWGCFDTKVSGIGTSHCTIPTPGGVHWCWNKYSC